MNSTKLMQLGILVMLFGIGLTLSITQAAFNLGASLSILRLLPIIGSITTVVGFVIGVYGFLQED